MDFITELQEGYNKIHNVDTPWVTLESECDFFTNKIKDFFSKDGEGSNIRALYEEIENNHKIDETKITQENFDNAESIYDEYLEGMHTFVEEVHGFQDTDDTSIMEAFSEKINHAIEEDHGFISMLESAENINPKKEVLYTEAASVLSNLVNFIDRMDSQKESCAFIKESLDTNDLTKNSAKLICESVSYYWLTSITNMVDSYKNLYEAVMHKDDEPIATIPFVLV